MTGSINNSFRLAEYSADYPFDEGELTGTFNNTVPDYCGDYPFDEDEFKGTSDKTVPGYCGDYPFAEAKAENPSFVRC